MNYFVSSIFNNKSRAGARLLWQARLHKHNLSVVAYINEVGKLLNYFYILPVNITQYHIIFNVQLKAPEIDAHSPD